MIRVFVLFFYAIMAISLSTELRRRAKHHLASAFLVFALSTFGGDSWALGALSAVTLILTVSLLWRPGESPILIWIVLYQWLQVNLVIFHAATFGVSIRSIAIWGDPEHAIVLSNIALAVLAIGIRAGCGPAFIAAIVSARAQAIREPRRVWVKLYFLSLVLSLVLESVASGAGPFSQIILSASTFLRWGFFWMLTYVSFVRRPFWKFWIVILMLEIGISLGGFFAGFSTVFFVSLMAAVAAIGIPSVRAVRPLVFLGVMTVLFGLTWTSIKDEYRKFVNRGSAQQVVMVDRLAQFEKLRDLSTEAGVLSRDNISHFMERVEYVAFFGRVLEIVPAEVPHSDGNIWFDALLRPFMPRVLFSGKSDINDSERTNQYTRLGVATAEHGTSYSLGYVPEAYIDFGNLWMFVPIALLGLLVGSYYRWMHTAVGGFGVWRMGLVTSALFPMIPFESSITKTFGMLVMSMLIGWCMVAFGMKSLVIWAGRRLVRPT